ncbi:DHA2 family efflux MFS transporter permease subunit [Streptomyces sp. NRRL F-5053]|uniref:DHA2 family efflux MFS transporter permease subunit n=1 Tax=Streptomyces sp. NRRL F-5053 TaxID=1463854 RepID=UPI000691567C|nr:DHA2 family efflux MFS transporter permease subunit [Streptomyces sp. NRRL F-5053]
MRTRNKWWPLVGLSLGGFMLLIDVTIVNTALPRMATSLDASFTSLQWVVDVYAVALAALLLVAGSVADLYGRRRVFTGGLVLFAVASLACGLAPDVGTLIAARTVQGIGAAGVFAANAPLITAVYSGRDRGIAFGVWGAVNGAAAGCGLALGGLLTEYLNWRWIFFVNLPLTAIALWITFRSISESRAPGSARARVDWLGAVLFTLAAGALTYGLVRGGDAGWGDTRAVASLVTAGVAALVFVLVERRHRAPLLDLSLLRNRSFAVLMITALLAQAAAFTHFVYSALWAQSVLGMSPLSAGLAMLPMAGVSFLVAAVWGSRLQRMRPQYPLGIGVLVIGVGVLLQTMVAPGSSWTALLPGCVVIGVGVGMALTVLIAAALAAVPPHRAGVASGAVNTFRQLGYALGVAVLGTLFASRVHEVLTGHGVAPGAAEAAGSGRAAQAGVPMHLVREAFAAGLDRIFVVCGAAALLTGVAVLLFVRARDTAGHGDGHGHGNAAGHGNGAGNGHGPEAVSGAGVASGVPAQSAPVVSGASGARGV